MGLQFPLSFFSAMTGMQIARKRASFRLKKARTDIRDLCKMLKQKRSAARFMKSSRKVQKETIQDLEGNILQLEGAHDQLKTDQAAFKAKVAHADEELAVSMDKISALQDHCEELAVQKEEAEAASEKASDDATKTDETVSVQKQIVNLYKMIYELGEEGMTFPSMTTQQIQASYKMHTVADIDAAITTKMDAIEFLWGLAVDGLDYHESLVKGPFINLDKNTKDVEELKVYIASLLHIHDNEETETCARKRKSMSFLQKDSDADDEDVKEPAQKKAKSEE
jgi:hypothetical protein